MLTLVVRRVVRLVVVLVGVSLVTFAILHVSGDPVSLMMPEAPESDRAMLRQSMGFNDPLPLQFARRGPGALRRKHAGTQFPIGSNRAIVKSCRRH